MTAPLAASPEFKCVWNSVFVQWYSLEGKPRPEALKWNLTTLKTIVRKHGTRTMSGQRQRWSQTRRMKSFGVVSTAVLGSLPNSQTCRLAYSWTDWNEHRLSKCQLREWSMKCWRADIYNAPDVTTMYTVWSLGLDPWTCSISGYAVRPWMEPRSDVSCSCPPPQFL